jgi:hypothetical protein
MNCACKESEPIINQGAGCTVNVVSNAIDKGKSYTAALYSDARSASKAITSAIAEEYLNSVRLVFEFPASETVKLKPGSIAIFEFWDTDEKKHLAFRNNFAKVRPCALSN